MPSIQMTAKRNINQDRKATAHLLATVANGGKVPAGLPSWLAHRGGNGMIDAQLLSGATMAQMRQHRGAVAEHLRHLKVEHGLTIIKIGNVYRLI